MILGKDGSKDYLGGIGETVVKPKDPREKLIAFMQLKSDLLQLWDPEAPLLFVEEDEEDMRTWGYATSMTIVEHLLNCSVYNDGVICPACLYYNGCNDCSYAMIHEKCTEKESTYYIITEKVVIINQLTPEGIALLRKTLVN